MTAYELNSCLIVIKRVIDEQIKLRENAIAQSNLLTEYKRMFVHHPSHRRQSKESRKPIQPEEEGGLMSIFVSLLAEPLSRTGSARSDEDHLTIELVLHLLRNLLSAGVPLSKSSEKIQASSVLHQEIIALFDRELVFEIMLMLCQEMESRENKQYNLLVMEILYHLLRNQDPTLVARSMKSEFKTTTSKSKGKNTPINSRFSTLNQGSSGPFSLKAQLHKEKQTMRNVSSSRHSHFGGTLVLEKSGGKQRYLSTTMSQSNRSRAGATSQGVQIKTKSKKHQYFVGSGRSLAAYTRPGAAKSSALQTPGPTLKRAQQSLHSFCKRFLRQCYGPVMKSLKNEFRRDSTRLEEEDKVIFFRLVWFFTQWWRISFTEGTIKSQGKGPDKSSNNDLGHLIFTMDVFTFNLVLTSQDYYFEHQKYASLGQAVSLYVEMMHLLRFMFKSSDSTEKIMALGLMDKLFYQTDAIDRLPKLLSKWTPATFSREYICDLIELTHVTLQTLDDNAKDCEGFHREGRNKTKKRNSNGELKDTISKMREMASDFEVGSYITRKIVSNQVVIMFTHVLSQYEVNAKHINDHIVAFFERLCKFRVVRDQEYDFETSDSNDQNDVTLEPILYNLTVLSVFNEILNDSSVRGDKDYQSILSFASTIVRHFSQASTKNPLLFVEALFRHPMPHRFCEYSNNLYVSDEVNMILERDILLAQSNHDDSEDDQKGYASSGDEVEFSDEIADSLLRERVTKSVRKMEKNLDSANSVVAKITSTEDGATVKNITTTDLSVVGGESSSAVRKGFKRIRKATTQEESDDEDFGEAPTTLQSSQLVFDDSDDE